MMPIGRFLVTLIAGLLVLSLLCGASLEPARAQTDPGGPAVAPGLPAINAIPAPVAAAGKPASPPIDIPKGKLYLSALLSHDGQPIAKGPIHWRIFDEKTDAQGRHEMIAESTEAAPHVHVAARHLSRSCRARSLQRRPPGDGDQPAVERTAGPERGRPAYRRMLGDKPINPAKLSIVIYVPEAGNSEAKLVLSSARAGDLIAVPEGNYHVVSTLLDTAGYSGTQNSGVGNKTNSVISADLKVQAGKLTDATLRHRSAVMTLKLVNDAGGEALANTAFTILTPGGDVIRELIGAFPSVVLAEGEYVVIARHDTKTYPSTFKVTSTLDRDVEVLAK